MVPLYQKLTYAHKAARCDATGKRSLCIDQAMEKEINQRKSCTFQARLPHAGKSARKLDKRGYIVDINGR